MSGIDVEDRDLGARRAGLGDPKRDVARAAGDVEMAKRAPPRRPDLGRESILPDAVEPAGHQIVHEIVARRDLVEHGIDAFLLLVERHAGKAEMGLLGHESPGDARAAWVGAMVWRGISGLAILISPCGGMGREPRQVGHSAYYYLDHAAVAPYS